MSSQGTFWGAIVFVAALVYLLRRPAIRAARLFFDMLLFGRRTLIDLGTAALLRMEARGDRFWMVVLALLGAAIYLPYLGSFPLWDPWEPHYTQVAWEMAERNTWLNPWYRGRDNWWSKPILLLWMLRSSLGLLWDPVQQFGQHEWAARLPFALSAIGGGILQYHWSRLLFGRAIGLLSAIALLTAPQYLLIGRQVMIDVPFVVTHSASIGYLGVALFTIRTGNRWQRHWPWIMFWVLQALSALAKGFLPPAMVALGLGGYAVLTFRWRDYSDLTAHRYWPRYAVTRGGWALGLGAITVGAMAALGMVTTLRPEQRGLYQAMVGTVGGLGITLGIFHDFPPCRHIHHLLRRIHALWGLAAFLAVCAPWYVYMSFKHGWPYWNEFIFYHHLGRAAGTIDKPGHTFDYYLLQLGFALFPWSAFLLGTVWRFVARCNPLRSIEERRNAYVLMAALMPYLFFTLSGTKFAHYIFPVVPFFAVMVAAVLVWLVQLPKSPTLGEPSPALGADIPSSSDSPPIQRGEVLVFAALALISFGVLAHDGALDFRLFLRLFIYYYNRATPHEYFPFFDLQTIFIPIGLVLASLLLVTSIRRSHLIAFSAGAVGFAVYLGWITMPAMGSTYSFKPFYEAFHALAKPGEEVGQYNDWQQPVRSVIFLFQNRAHHLKTDRQARSFLQRPGRKFILADRNRLPKLRKAAKEIDKKLFVVFDDHPYGRLVSDEPNPEDARRVAEHILKEVPPGVRRVNADFGTLELIGWKADPGTVVPGQSVEVSFYYRAKEIIEKDWQIFVHGDGPRGGSHRLHQDHFPLDGLYPTTEWQAGEIVKDHFTIQVPGDYPFDTFTVWTGFYIGQDRLELKNTAPNDGNNRVRGPRFQVARN